MTRLQFFVVIVLLVLILCHAVGLSLLGDLTKAMKEPAPAPRPMHGIETSWKTATGGERVWTVNGAGDDFHPWLEAHISAVTEAQRMLPIERK